VGTPGECIHRDKGNEIDRKVINSEYVVLLSSLTFGGYSPDMKIIVDRFLPLILPFFTTIKGETHHSMRYDRAPFLIGVAVSDGHSKEEGEIFSALIVRNGLNFGCVRTGHIIIDRTSNPDSLTKSLRILMKEKEVVK
jgi:multimeric flavodoxin WrbA